MTGSVALDVVIGLVFIYLLYSLLASIIQEVIATWLGLRANVLEQGIVRMLNDGREGSWVTARLRSWWRVLRRYDPGGMASGFYKHPMIKYLSEDEYHNKPSYITQQNFSKVLIDLLKDDVGLEGEAAKARITEVLNGTHIGSVPMQPDTQKFLLSLWTDAGHDTERFKTLLEGWFNDMQERIAGWYKRYVQVFLFAIGLCIALVGNVDTLELIGKLSKDPELREQVLAQAESFQTKYAEYAAVVENNKTAGAIDPTAQDQLARMKQRSDSLTQLATDLVHGDVNDVSQLFGLGREFPDKVVVDSVTGKALSVYDGCKLKPDSVSTGVERHLADRIRRMLHEKDSIKGMVQYRKGDEVYVGMEICWFHKVIYGLQWPTKRNWVGYFFTAMAISLGAPFWFDLLNKLMKARAAIRGGTEQPKNDAARTDPTETN